MREPPGLLKLPFRLARLQLSHHNSADQGEENKDSGGHAEFVPPGEFRCTIPRRVFACGNRFVVEVPLKVDAERPNPGVAPRRFLPKGFEKNIVEIATQLPGDRWICRRHAWPNRLGLGHDSEQFRWWRLRDR